MYPACQVSHPLIIVRNMFRIGKSQIIAIVKIPFRLEQGLVGNS